MENLIILDGGTGTEIKRRGHELPSSIESIWSAQVLIDNPEVVEQIHYDYIQAGADHIIINNYALTQPILSRAKLSTKLEELTLLSIEVAKSAQKRSGKNVKIIGSLPPLETSYQSDLLLDEDQMYKNYLVISSLLKNNVDIIICETMSSSLESKTALKAALTTGIETWVSWTLHGNRTNMLPSGETLSEAFNALTPLKADAYLINCCAANFITAGIVNLRNLTDKPIGGYGNSVLVKDKTETNKMEINPRQSQRDASETIDEKRYTLEVSKWIDNGATIIGGCCYTTPNHIKEIKSLVSTY